VRSGADGRGLADTADDITAVGRGAIVIPADVTDQVGVGGAVATAIDPTPATWTSW
jgi:hypothetical protein